MAKNKVRRRVTKSVNSIPPKLPPIVFVPDKTYIGDTGDIIPMDVILVADPVMYMKMKKILDVWGKEQMGVDGKRGEIEG